MHVFSTWPSKRSKNGSPATYVKLNCHHATLSGVKDTVYLDLYILPITLESVWQPGQLAHIALHNSVQKRDFVLVELSKSNGYLISNKIRKHLCFQGFVQQTVGQQTMEFYSFSSQDGRTSSILSGFERAGPIVLGIPKLMPRPQSSPLLGTLCENLLHGSVNKQKIIL